ncbi:MAG: DUF4252 domain-containing protein [Flavobacterium sp.]|nr:DUF4252 domain-containing protein [Flavobacterium sp.]
MRKLVFTIVLALMPVIFFGQSVFDKFDGPDEITTVIVTKKMFSMIGGVDTKDKEAQQYMALVKKLDNLKVFTTESSKYAADMKTTADKYAKTAGLEELMRVNDKGQSIKIMIKSGAKDTQVRELLMFIEGTGKNNQTVLLSLMGNFDLNELSVLTDKMNLPGGDSLKKAGKGAK